MTRIRIIRTDPDGHEERRDIHVARPPDQWEVADARTFLHDLQKASATPDCPLAHLDGVRLHEPGRLDVVAIEVATNAGVVVTEPLHLSPVALAWLDEVQYEHGPRDVLTLVSCTQTKQRIVH